MYNFTQLVLHFYRKHRPMNHKDDNPMRKQDFEEASIRAFMGPLDGAQRSSAFDGLEPAGDAPAAPAPQEIRFADCREVTAYVLMEGAPPAARGFAPPTAICASVNIEELADKLKEKPYHTVRPMKVYETPDGQLLAKNFTYPAAPQTVAQSMMGAQRQAMAQSNPQRDDVLKGLARTQEGGLANALDTGPKHYPDFPSNLDPTPYVRKRLVEMHDAGYTLSRMAWHFQASRASVAHELGHLGYELPPMY